MVTTAWGEHDTQLMVPWKMLLTWDYIPTLGLLISSKPQKQLSRLILLARVPLWQRLFFHCIILWDLLFHYDGRTALKTYQSNGHMLGFFFYYLLYKSLLTSKMLWNKYIMDSNGYSTQLTWLQWKESKKICRRMDWRQRDRSLRIPSPSFVSC